MQPPGTNFWRRPIDKGVAIMFFDILKIHGIEESSVYQAIYAKGRANAARESLLHLGRKEWGEPDERVLSQIMAIDDLDCLHDLIDHVFDASASSWDELLPPAVSSV
jgi:hypothetical protein